MTKFILNSWLNLGTTDIYNLSHGGIKGTRLTPFHKQVKTGQNLWNNDFQALRQQAYDYWEKANKLGGPHKCPSLLPKENFRLHWSEGELK